MKQSKKYFSDLFKAIGNETDEIERIKKIELLCRKIYACAIRGEAWAVNFIADRTEGKIKNTDEMTDKNIDLSEFAELIKNNYTVEK